MTMVKRNRLRNCRKKAVFGADGAIMAAATLAAAGIGAAASANAAKMQAQAVESSANKNAEALIKQNENNIRLQEKSIQFTKEQNERNRELQKEVQMNLQLLTGQQNTNELKEAAKIQVKCGGSMRKRLRNAGAVSSASFLRGGNNNLPFTVTDGGSVIPLRSTPEGYDLYEIIGNDHEHYHKAQGGRNKTGVGIKFAGRQTIEGEGNQNTNQGELMLVTPTDAKFISKHTLRGYNPRQAVMMGVHPLIAFAQQEAIKDANGISDDGKSDNNPPVRRMNEYGGNTTFPISPDLSLDFLAPVAAGVIAGTRQDLQARNGRCLKKCGGSRKRAWGGTWWNNLNDTQKGNIAGAGWNAAGNLGGALITSLGNYYANKYLTSSYSNAANTLAKAYNNLKSIDMSAINRDDFNAAHAMAALQAPIVNDGAQKAAAKRSRDRMIRRINNSTLSSAAALNRIGRVESDYNDRIAQIAEGSDRIRQGIIQENMRRLTDVSQRNAELDTQANQAYSQAYLNLLQYNNDIANQRITGAAQAQADALTQNATSTANMRQANAASLAGALTSGIGGIGNAIATNNKMSHEEAMTMMGSTIEQQVKYYLDHPNASGKENLIKMLEGSTNPDYIRWYNILNS